MSLKTLRESLIQTAQDNDLNETNEVTPNYEFESTLYLQNAMYFSGGSTIPGNESALITVDISSVDAFSMGKLKQK